MPDKPSFSFQAALFDATPQEMEWSRKAACQGYEGGDSVEDPWFPYEHEGRPMSREDQERTKLAVSICRDQCPVREECLDYAMRTHQRFGIWGGFTYIQRLGLRRKLSRKPGGFSGKPRKDWSLNGIR